MPANSTSPNGSDASHRSRGAFLRTLPQRLHANVIFRWLVHGVSRCLTLSARPAIIVSPHPDDETLGCGGLIALKRRQGVSVQAVFLTDGTAGPAPSAGMSAGELACVRRGEARAAGRALGIEQHVHFLGGPDGALATLPAAHRAEFVRQLREMFDAHGPGEVFVTHRSDCHPDHEAAYALVRDAVSGCQAEIELIEYSIWMAWSAPILFRLKPRQLAGSRRLCIESVFAQKHAAIRAYRSQCATLPRGFLDRFLTPYELFFQPAKLR